MVTIHTDGSAYPNPGPGGWAAIIDGKEIVGSEKLTTNNRMEIIAVLRALQEIKEPSNIKIYSDSTYVVNSIGCWKNGKPTKKGWMISWKNKGWKRPEKWFAGKHDDGELKNADLWKEIDALVKLHESVELIWVRGHNDNELNEKCDKLALEARTNQQ